MPDNTATTDCQPEITEETMGFTVNMYTRTGGCIGFWKPTLKEALDEIVHWKEHEGYTLVKTSYKGRVERHVINEARNLVDAGIFTRKIIRTPRRFIHA